MEPHPWRAVCAERCQHGSGRGGWKRSKTERVEKSIGVETQWKHFSESVAEEPRWPPTSWYRNDKAAVAEALRRGERPDLATTMASGPLDELVALHQELGIFAALEELEVQRERAGVPDGVLLRTLATLPFVEAASPPWRKSGALPRASRALAIGLGPSANPLGQQSAASSP